MHLPSLTRIGAFATIAAILVGCVLFLGALAKLFLSPAPAWAAAAIAGLLLVVLTLLLMRPLLLPYAALWMPRAMARLQARPSLPTPSEQNPRSDASRPPEEAARTQALNNS